MTAFFYMWYGTQAHDGAWRHWNQLGHKPPGDIASVFYPVGGAYASRDSQVLARQMAELVRARIGVIAVSWWGQGSWDDNSLDALFAAAETAGIKVAFHIEPYEGQTAAGVVADIHYLLGRYGTSPTLYRVSRPTAASASTAPRAVFYIFASSRFARADLKTALNGLRGTTDDSIVMVHSPKASTAAMVGADGVYTYDPLASPTEFAQLAADSQAGNVIFSPGVSPGFNNSQAVSPANQVIDRANGDRYDSMWQAAIASGAEWVSVVSFNEWHEGTQIEPAADMTTSGRTYVGYGGAYGIGAADAPAAYLARTAYWVSQLTQGR